MTKTPDKLCAGDKTPWYTVRSVRVKHNEIIAEIIHNDGGTDTRRWDINSKYPIQVIPAN